jgi:hypothetical protein
VKAVQSAQDDAARRAAQRAADVAAVQRQFADDPPNSPALNDALASINSRYEALAQLDNTRIEDAQAALANWDEAQK